MINLSQVTPFSLALLAMAIVAIGCYLFMVYHGHALTQKQRVTLWLLMLMSTTSTLIPIDQKAIPLFAISVLVFTVSLLDSYSPNPFITLVVRFFRRTYYARKI